MICKWCGAAIDPAQKSCGNCGREIPPLSDCGGFYDVVPTRRPAAPTPSAPAAPQAGGSRAAEHPAAKPQPTAAHRRGKHAPVLSIVTLALLLALALLFALRESALRRELSQLTSQAEEQEARIDELEAELAERKDGPTAPDADRDDVPDKPDGPEEPEKPDTPDDPDESGEPEGSDDTNLSDSELTYTVTPGQDENYTADDGRKRVTLNPDSESDKWNYVVSGEPERLWWAQLSDTSKEQGLMQDKAFTFSYGVDEDRLGKPEEQAFAWYYYSDADEDWVLLTEDPDENVEIKSESAEGKSTVTIVKAWLREQLGIEETDSSISLRLKCVVTRRSKDGGSITICFEHSEFII